MDKLLPINLLSNQPNSQPSHKFTANLIAYRQKKTTFFIGYETEHCEQSLSLGIHIQFANRGPDLGIHNQLPSPRNWASPSL